MCPEDVVIKDLIAAQAVYFQHRVIDWQNQKGPRLLTAERPVATNLVVEAGDPLFVDRPEQNQVAAMATESIAV